LEFPGTSASCKPSIIEVSRDSFDTVAVKRFEISTTCDGSDGCSDFFFALGFLVLCGSAESRRAYAAFRICLPNARCEGFGFIAVSASVAAFSVA
jgi:hypothetical protein